MPDKRFLLKTPAEKLIIWEKPELLTGDKEASVRAGGEVVPGKPRADNGSSGETQVRQSIIKHLISGPVTTGRAVTQTLRVWRL